MRSPSSGSAATARSVYSEPNNSGKASFAVNFKNLLYYLF